MNFQLVIDCAEPEPLVRFWAEALDYHVPDAPAPHATWREFYLSIGVPEQELGDGDCADRLADPKGEGPDIWFQIVPEGKPEEPRTDPRSKRLVWPDLVATWGSRAGSGSRGSVRS